MADGTETSDEPEVTPPKFIDVVKKVIQNFGNVGESEVRVAKMFLTNQSTGFRWEVEHWWHMNKRRPDIFMRGIFRLLYPFGSTYSRLCHSTTGGLCREVRWYYLGSRGSGDGHVRREPNTPGSTGTTRCWRVQGTDGHYVITYVLECGSLYLCEDKWFRRQQLNKTVCIRSTILISSFSQGERATLENFDWRWICQKSTPGLPCPIYGGHRSVSLVLLYSKTLVAVLPIFWWLRWLHLCIVMTNSVAQRYLSWGTGPCMEGHHGFCVWSGGYGGRWED